MKKLFHPTPLLILLAFFYCLTLPNILTPQNPNPKIKKKTKNQYVHTLLSDPKPSKRRFAALILDQHPHPDSINALITALDDIDPHVRKNAVRSLAKLNARQSIPKILQLISEPQISSQVQVIRSLGLLKASQSVFPLIQLMKKNPKKAIKMSCLFAFAQIKDKRALRTVIQSLFDADPQVRVFATDSISEFKNKASIPFLKHVYSHDSELRVRQSAAISLKKLGISVKIPSNIP